MKKIKPFLHFIIYKILRLPNRIIMIDNPKLTAVTRSLAFYWARELVDFDSEIQRQPKKLERSNMTRPTPDLDVLLQGDESDKHCKESDNGEEER